MEELRFISEQLIAEFLFILPVAPKRRHFIPKCIIGALICLCCSFGYAGVLKLCDIFPALGAFFNITWYILLTIVTLAYMYACFELPLSQIVFRGICAYSVQHIEYTLVNEIFAIGVYPEIRNILWLYAIICVTTYALFCTAVYFLFVKKFKDIQSITVENKYTSAITYSLMFAALISTNFICQSLFMLDWGETDFEPHYNAAIADLLFCSITLLLQFMFCSDAARRNEIAVINQILYNNGKQYELKKENIELINHKCHDLKHQIAALEFMPEEERSAHIEQLKKTVNFYSEAVDTHNEVLNTVLVEKLLYCLDHKIKLSFNGDASPLSFMDTVDLFTLFGNAVDNAIESVIKLENTDLRSIDCRIADKNGVIQFSISNCYVGKIEFSDGLPQTSKNDNSYHGFGMSGMRRILHKYGGTMTVDASDGIFTLTFIIPTPLQSLHAN